MPLYENIFIARQDISAVQVDALTTALKEIIAEQGGKVNKTEYCGLRPLAYPIRNNNKGHYILMNISLEHKALQELERKMGLNEDILRFLTIRVEEHGEEPSALFQQSKNYRTR